MVYSDKHQPQNTEFVAHVAFFGRNRCVFSQYIYCVCVGPWAARMAATQRSRIQRFRSKPSPTPTTPTTPATPATPQPRLRSSMMSSTTRRSCLPSAPAKPCIPLKVTATTLVWNKNSYCKYDACWLAAGWGPVISGINLSDGKRVEEFVSLKWGGGGAGIWSFCSNVWRSVNINTQISPLHYFQIKFGKFFKAAQHKAQCTWRGGTALWSIWALLLVCINCSFDMCVFFALLIAGLTLKMWCEVSVVPNEFSNIAVILQVFFFLVIWSFPLKFIFPVNVPINE